MIFLRGEHTLKVQAIITNATSFSMVGESVNTSRIMCTQSGCGGFYFQFVSSLSISSLSFVSDSHSINAMYVNDFQLTNCTFSDSLDAVITVSFCEQVTFRGIHTFQNNTGSAIYAEYSAITFDGNASFINNRGSIGGAIYLLRTPVNITSTGRVLLINNSASGDFGGGGMYLLNSHVNITGTLSLTNNSAKFGGGFYLDIYSKIYFHPTATTHVYFSKNYGQRGGAIYVKDYSPLSCNRRVLFSDSRFSRF